MVQQRIAVIDTETTGLDPSDQVLEVAVVQGTWNGKILSLDSTFTSLVRPTVPVKPEARAAHHISDDELRKAPTWEKLAKKLPDLTGCVVAAHNAPFDLRLLAQSGLGGWIGRLPVVDTCQVARHAFPGAPNYQNQVLRYWLELAVPAPYDVQAPHRALPDTMATFALMERELQWCGDPERLVELSTMPVLEVECGIGKWKGKPWSEVDAGMLRWILGRDFNDNVKHTARHWLAQPRDRNGRVKAADEVDDRRSAAGR
jgi:exodeoxyribonuclease X